MANWSSDASRPHAFWRICGQLGALGAIGRQHLPTQCWVCWRWPVFTPICDTCLHQHAGGRLRCRHCALPLPALADTAIPLLPAPIRLCADCLRKDAKNLPTPAACWAAVDYNGPWRTLVQRWKLGQQPALAQAAAHLMAAQLPWDEILAGVDALVPVPASPQRLRERGFQPTLSLARALSSRLTPSLGALPPMWPQALLRLPERDTLHQALRGRQARLRAMQGAFIVPPAALPQIQGCKLLLLDDVMTTGATLSSAAQALHQAGAAQVQAVVLARTPRA